MPMKHGRRAAVIAAAVAVVISGPAASAVASPHAITPAGAAAAGRSRTGQAATLLTGGSGASTSWTPVPYQNAQLSVPGSWLVESPQQLWCGLSQSGGMIFAGMRPRIPKGMGCGVTANVAWISPAGHLRHGIGHRRPTAVINGIPVYRLRSGKESVLYLVPELGVRVGARGPNARRVLATLTRSPLSVVLSRGPAGRVPASWTWRRFGGFRFSTPRDWSLRRAPQWATCGTGLVPRTLLLIDAVRPPLRLPCPYPIPTATADQAQPGLTVVTGTYAAESIGQNYLRCQLRHGVRICLSTVTGQGGFYSGVLIFSVSRPQRHAATFFLLGLSGTGARARTILGSISAAPRNPDHGRASRAAKRQGHASSALPVRARSTADRAQAADHALSPAMPPVEA